MLYAMQNLVMLNIIDGLHVVYIIFVCRNFVFWRNHIAQPMSICRDFIVIVVNCSLYSIKYTAINVPMFWGVMTIHNLLYLLF